MKYYLPYLILLAISCNSNLNVDIYEKDLKKYFDHKILIDSILSREDHYSNFSFSNGFVSFTSISKANSNEKCRNGCIELVDLEKKILKDELVDTIPYMLKLIDLEDSVLLLSSKSNVSDIFLYKIEEGKFKGDIDHIKLDVNVYGMSFQRKGDLLFFEGSPYGTYVVNIVNNKMINIPQKGTINPVFSKFSKPIDAGFNLMFGKPVFEKERLIGVCFDNSYNIKWMKEFGIINQSFPFFESINTKKSFIVCNQNNIKSLEKLSGSLNWEINLSEFVEKIFVEKNILYIIHKNGNKNKDQLAISTYSIENGILLKQANLNIVSSANISLSNNDKYIFIGSKNVLEILDIEKLISNETIEYLNLPLFDSYLVNNIRYTVVGKYIFW